MNNLVEVNDGFIGSVDNMMNTSSPEENIRQAFGNMTQVIDSFIESLASSDFPVPLRERFRAFNVVDPGRLIAREIAEKYVPELADYGAYHPNACGTAFNIPLKDGPTVRLAGSGSGLSFWLIESGKQITEGRRIEISSDYSGGVAHVTGLTVRDLNPKIDINSRPLGLREIWGYQSVAVGAKSGRPMFLGARADLSHVSLVKSNRALGYQPSPDCYLTGIYTLRKDLVAELTEVEFKDDSSRTEVSFVPDKGRLIKQPIAFNKNADFYTLFDDSIGNVEGVDDTHWLVLPRKFKTIFNKELGIWESDTEYSGLLVPKQVDIGHQIRAMLNLAGEKRLLSR